MVDFGRGRARLSMDFLVFLSDGNPRSGALDPLWADAAGEPVCGRGLSGLLQRRAAKLRTGQTGCAAMGRGGADLFSFVLFQCVGDAAIENPVCADFRDFGCGRDL